MRASHRAGRLPLAIVALRAIVIVSTGVAGGYYLLNEGIEQGVFSDTLPGYQDWGSLISMLRASSDAFDGLLITLQLTAAGAAIALIAATLLSFISRWRLFRDGLRLSIVPLVSLLAPVTALLSYWLTRQIGAAPTSAFEGIEAGLGSAISNGWLPAVVLAVSMLPGLSALLNRRAPAIAELGWASGAAQLASRSAPHNQWTLGLPAGATVLALAVVESLYAPAGLFGRFATAIDPAESELLLTILFIVCVAGAILSIEVDLFGRAAPTNNTHDYVGLRTRTDGRVAAFGFAVGMVGLGALLVAALIGGSVDAGVSALADPLSSPFSNGYLLGSDGEGRDLLNLALSATGSALQRALIPAAIASVLGAVLAAIAYYLPRLGQLIPGTIVDLLWWPTPLFGLLTLTIWGVGDELQLLTSAVLVPVAYRLAQREILGAPVGTGRRFGGVIALVAAGAFAIDTALGFIAASSYAIDANWGTQLASSSETINTSVWPALIPSLAIVLFAFVLNLAGSYLVASGWTAWLASPEARRAAAEARDAAGAPPGPAMPNEEASEPAVPLSLPISSGQAGQHVEDNTAGNPDEASQQDSAGKRIRPSAFPQPDDHPGERPPRAPIVVHGSDRLLSPPPLVPGNADPSAAPADTPLPPPMPLP